MPACEPGTRPAKAGRYRPRQALTTPLYRLFQDHLETFLAQRKPGDAPAHPSLIESSLRAFLECGVHRFGMVRYRCPRCDESLFVAFSCKRRVTCPSCDGKRAAVTTAHALDALLPDVAYRQWVLVVPKRLRYFIHRAPALAGDICGILARELGRYYAGKLGEGLPAQIHFVQRFGSALNLHLHDHAVVSDGVFRNVDGRLEFLPAEAPTEAELAGIIEAVRKKTLRRFARLGLLAGEVLRDMQGWEHSGFSLHAGTTTPAGDREALERLLYYCGRPALSVKRLEYRKSEGLAVYDVRSNGFGNRRLVLPALDFIDRLAKLFPPPRKNLVRYYGALGPNSPLRPLLSEAAAALSAKGALEPVREFVSRAVRACSSAWAKCLSRVFEVDALLCSQCGVRMVPVAAILADKELVRVLEYLGLPTEFPVLKPSRSPPAGDEETQAGPEGLYECVDRAPPDDERQRTDEDT